MSSLAKWSRKIKIMLKIRHYCPKCKKYTHSERNEILLEDGYINSYFYKECGHETHDSKLALELLKILKN